MRILACDPGSNFGWATNQTGRLEWGTENFSIKNGESSGNRWRRFGRWLDDTSLHQTDGAAAFHPVIDPSHGRECGCMECNRKYGFGAWMEPCVDLIVYERAMFMPKARAAAEIAAGFTTRLEEHCERHGIALQPVAVQTLKAFAIPAVKRKKGDPKMDRSKTAMILAAKWNLTHLAPSWDAQRDGITEHEADALHLYWYALVNFATPSATSPADSPRQAE